MDKHKVRISFELDLTDCPGYRPEDKDSLDGVLQNLSSWLGGLRSAYLEEGIRWLTDNKDCDPEMAELMYKHFHEKAELAKQIFNQYKVEGCLTNGTQFVFTHNEAYEESTSFGEELVSTSHNSKV